MDKHSLTSTNLLFKDQPDGTITDEAKRIWDTVKNGKVGLLVQLVKERREAKATISAKTNQINKMSGDAVVGFNMRHSGNAEYENYIRIKEGLRDPVEPTEMMYFYLCAMIEALSQKVTGESTDQLVKNSMETLKKTLKKKGKKNEDTEPSTTDQPTSVK